jgi:hypothetical protein
MFVLNSPKTNYDLYISDKANDNRDSFLDIGGSYEKIK